MSEPVIRDHAGVNVPATENLDEVCIANPAFVHLEQMSKGAWWLRIDLADGRGVVVRLYSKRRIRGGVEIEAGPAVPPEPVEAPPPYEPWARAFAEALSGNLHDHLGVRHAIDEADRVAGKGPAR